MSCSPLLKGITDPLQVLGVIVAHPILQYSESSQTFYPLQEKGWVDYRSGYWEITEKGRKTLLEIKNNDKAESMSVADFFNL